MHDVLDIIRNVQDLYSISPTLGVLKDFERVVDELDVYVFKNWDEGELLSGNNNPEVLAELKQVLLKLFHLGALSKNSIKKYLSQFK